jgi:hypothetical protein
MRCSRLLCSVPRKRERSGVRRDLAVGGGKEGKQGEKEKKILIYHILHAIKQTYSTARCY